MAIKYPVKVYEWRPHLLAAYSFDQLNDLMRFVEDTHRNPRNEAGRYTEDGQETLFIFDAKGRRKLDAITWAIYHKQKAQKRNPLRAKAFRT
ncbi:hypothetical protein GTB64_004513 [Salmonella enterica]|nr:hypothetical protein [Salmonella enterica]